MNYPMHVLIQTCTTDRLHSTIGDVHSVSSIHFG